MNDIAANKIQSIQLGPHELFTLGVKNSGCAGRNGYNCW